MKLGATDRVTSQTWRQNTDRNDDKAIFENENTIFENENAVF